MTSYVESIREALDRSLAKSTKVCIVGEDIIDPYGGAFKVTKGLSTKYPKQVFTTPISESAIIGIATGMAMRGFRPVAEIMFGDFITLCADQIINSAAKFPLMYRGSVTVPSVIRTPVGGGRGYGPTHSQSLEKLFFGIPGLEVIAPSRLHDPGVMLEHIIFNNEAPVLFVEDKSDYAKQVYPSAYNNLFIKNSNMNDALPTKVATNYPTEQRPDIAIIAYGGAASIAAEVLDELKDEEVYGILVAPARVNCLDELRVVVETLPKQIPVLIAEQGTFGFGWASELMSIMLEANRSGATVTRLATKPDVIPSAKHLEADVILSADLIKNTIFEVIL